jgi:hypothetical protein
MEFVVGLGSVAVALPAALWISRWLIERLLGGAFPR